MKDPRRGNVESNEGERMSSLKAQDGKREKRQQTTELKTPEKHEQVEELVMMTEDEPFDRIPPSERAGSEEAHFRRELKMEGQSRVKLLTSDWNQRLHIIRTLHNNWVAEPERISRTVTEEVHTRGLIASAAARGSQHAFIHSLPSASCRSFPRAVAPSPTKLCAESARKTPATPQRLCTFYSKVAGSETVEGGGSGGGGGGGGAAKRAAEDHRSPRLSQQLSFYTEGLPTRRNSILKQVLWKKSPSDSMK